MDARDRAHAVHVTRVLLERHPQASGALVRAALLHDVGKSGRPYRLWERVAAHLYDPGDVPAEPRLPGMRGAWQMRVHHARYGAEMVRRAGGSDRVADIIAAHHDADAGPEAAVLRAIDELT
jgi:putative nucleotidyltransferase with HDIG domain